MFTDVIDGYKHSRSREDVMAEATEPHNERISEAEHAVMEALWDKSPLTAAEVCDAVCEPRGWSMPTVKTLLSRLVAKNAVATEPDGRRFLYTPLLERADYVGGESRRLVDRLFDTLLYTGLLIALVLMLRRPAGRFFGPQFAYALWALPLLRLLLPPIVLPASLAPKAVQVRAVQVAEWAPAAAEAPVVSSVAPVTLGAASPPPAWEWIDLIALTVSLWAGVALAFLVFRFVTYHRMRRELLKGSRTTKGTTCSPISPRRRCSRCTGSIRSPGTAGVRCAATRRPLATRACSPAGAGKNVYAMPP
jgi:BlaI family penicillinase repressor